MVNNCTGSCSWKIYVRGGIVTWETQQTDYPRTRPDLPSHEPRGCARGASYSWYLYSGNRVEPTPEQLEVGLAAMAEILRVEADDYTAPARGGRGSE